MIKRGGADILIERRAVRRSHGTSIDSGTDLGVRDIRTRVASARPRSSGGFVAALLP